MFKKGELKMEYNRITLKEYLKTGKPLITNSYNAFDIPTLTTRIKTKYGRRLIRWDIEIDEISEIAQNAVDMYKDYLQEIFQLPQEYNIINPLHEETSRTLEYTKTGEGEEDTNKTENTSTSGTVNQTGTTGENSNFSEDITHGEKITREGTDNKTINGTVDTTGTGKSTITSNETTDGTTSGTKNDTTLTNVSAYNQTTDYAPRDQVIGNDTTSGTNHQEITGTSETDTNTTGKETTVRTEEGTTGGTDTHSGTDTRSGNNDKTGTSKLDTTKSETGETTGIINVKNNNTETYNMTEKATKDGHVKYEEIVNTLENLFSPYDWLGEKIVKAICEVFYL